MALKTHPSASGSFIYKITFVVPALRLHGKRMRLRSREPSSELRRVDKSIIVGGIDFATREEGLAGACKTLASLTPSHYFAD